MRSLISRCALGATVLITAALIAPAAVATGPEAVDDARSEVQELGREVEIAAEDYNEIRVRLGSQQDRVVAAQTRVRSQSTAIEQMRDELGALAVETFKRGGVDPQLAVLLGSPGDYLVSTSTLTLMAERRSVSLTDLRAAQDELVRLETVAEDELAEVVAMEADLAERKVDIDARLAAAEDVLAAAEAEAARIEAARRAAAEQATRSREAAEQRAAAAEAARASSTPSEATSAGATSAGATSSGSAAGGSSAGASSGSGASGSPAGSSGTAEVVVASAGTINCGGVPVEVPDARVATVLTFACGEMGKPYKWGASGPGSYDCSGFTAAAWAQVGVSLPHSSRAQAGYGTPVARGDMRPGDLVFNFSPISHVGIYIGGGRLVAAPSAGSVVKIQSLQYLPFAAAVRL